jgi:anthranilate phosphoribosyltransferase
VTDRFASALSALARKHDLAREEARACFDAIFAGNVRQEDIAAFLLGLHEKSETLDELIGAVESMRAHMLAVPAPPETMDIVGTGGDSHGTLNVSTAVALAVAGCGVPVAKHGNRASSSRSGSSDVLAALGINLDADLAKLETCLAEAHCCFLHAPRHHPAMRHVADVRKKLGVRTIFNLIGPLTNPAGVKRHLIGVYDLEWLGPMAEALKTLGSEAAWLAHGHDGMDEITTTAPTDVVELRRGMIGHFTLEPEHIGLPRAKLEDLKGGNAAQNAEAIREFLNGKAADLRKGLAQASEAVDGGAAHRMLEKLIALTA